MVGFIDTITVGETRKVSDAQITSIHFPILRYFALFASHCLIGRGNCGNLSIPDIIIFNQGSVATRPQTVQSLCLSVIPGLVCLHT